MPGKDHTGPTRLAEKIRYAREEVLHLNQRAFATRLDVSQSNVSKWETGDLVPESHHMMKLAEILDGRREALYFLEVAGVPPSYFLGEGRYSEDVMPSEIISASAPKSHIYQVPLLRDAAAAGTPRVVNEDEIEAWIPVLKNWAPRGSALVAVRVSGESMSPILMDSYVVVIDMAQRDPRKLLSKMVVARDPGGAVSIKWLRKDSGIFMLVPQHTSPRFPIMILNEDEGWNVVGAVVQWVGFPPAVRRAPNS